MSVDCWSKRGKRGHTNTLHILLLFCFSPVHGIVCRCKELQDGTSFKFCIALRRPGRARPNISCQRIPWGNLVQFVCYSPNVQSWNCFSFTCHQSVGTYFNSFVIWIVIFDVPFNVQRGLNLFTRCTTSLKWAGKTLSYIHPQLPLESWYTHPLLL